MSFSPLTSDGIISSAKEILGILVVQGHDLYLGLPTVSCRNKRMQFGYIRDRVVRRLGGWQNKLLSAGGKEVLIKSVVQAIPTYAMMYFRLPASICNDIDRACAQFWWGDREEKKNMHWAQWQKLCVPKDRGGLGFRNLICFNKALLAKQIWRMIKFPNSLIAQVFRSKYFKNGSVLDAKVGSNSSYAWRSLCWSRTLIGKGLRWKVGSRKSIRMFHDGFVSDIPSGIPKPIFQYHSYLKVSDFLTKDRCWDLEVLNEFFWPAMVACIAETPILQEGEDRCYWKMDEKGVYTVKSGYLLEYFEQSAFSSGPVRSDWKKLIWSLHIPPKIKNFLWRAVMDFIPTTMNLQAHHVPVNGICDRCCKDWGSTMHSLDLFEVWVVTIYLVWLGIYSEKHAADGPRPEVGICTARRWLEAFQAAQGVFKMAMTSGVKVGKKEWYPPIEGSYRLDVDAAVNEAENSFGVGAVVRNFRGELCAALAKSIQRPISVLDAELNAILYGVGLCLQEGLGPLVVYSDSLLAIRLIANGDEAKEYIANELGPLMDVVNSGVILEFRHMLREANCVAHSLAYFGASCVEMCTWNNDFPQWLRDLCG